MALGLYFDCGFAPDVYDESRSQLAQAGAGYGEIPGLLFHCAMEAGECIRVFDVWESMEHFQKFAETLLPILSKLGAAPGEPQVGTVLNMRNG